MKKICLSLLALIYFNASSQDYHVSLDYFLPNNISYNSEIPTPASVIGYELGDWHITHDKLLQYMYRLAESSDRISIENRGETFEGRPLILLYITAPKNQKNLQEIRKKHISLTEKGADNIEVTNLPIIVYQGFSIHGNEPSGSNAALAVAYYLAAAQGPEIELLLNKSVILFDPSYNPDGLQRFAYWANMHKGKNINPDPNDREYNEIWPGGRTNHYWFDMNRDWLPVQLPESQARIKTFHDWYPNILTDHHEMGTNSTFFFQPGIPSRTNPLTPNKNQELTGEIGKYHAKDLNKIGSLYYSKESFDDFYYGKGSTFPDINGGIGILFEQASSRGHAQESENGVLTFPFTIRNQFTAALSTLEAAIEMREEILNYQKTFYINARKESSNAGVIVFGDEKDATKAHKFIDVLKHHRIEVHYLKEDFSKNGKEFKKESSYVIPKNQKQHRLINAMFQKRTNFQDSLFYDVSAWTLPLAFNLDYEENESVNKLGDRISEKKRNTASLPLLSNYAYLMEWNDYNSPKVLNQLLEKGLRAKVGLKPFTLEGVKYDYGTILIPVQNQKLNTKELFKFIYELVEENKVRINSVSTGLSKGIDLGSRNFKMVGPQKVALLVGQGITPYDAGEIWHLFDQRYDMLITKLDTRDFRKKDLSKYTDIIVPNSWGTSLTKSDALKIKNWIKQGGTLIGYKNIGKWFDKHEILKIDFKTKKNTARSISFDQKRDFFGAQLIGGAIFETKIDRSHPIVFGYKNEKLPVFRNSTLFMKPDTNSYNNPIKYTNNPLLSGYISDKNLLELKNTSMCKIGTLEKGKVIYFTDNTNFRAFWYGTNKLLMNAIFFGNEM
ncbi:M14 family zinc carboxypeptidase [Flavobacteriaceae bacterium]|nr:M14 family zinc carboxypeptidase [Flavobacteriaceae bacterium]MDC6468099.1 M14 family zinc carboxypeptidase [Flavobacteriaceae bacterium]